MAQVEYLGKASWTFGTKKFVNGVNEVNDDFLKSMLTNSLVRARIVKGLFKVPEDFLEKKQESTKEETSVKESKKSSKVSDSTDDETQQDATDTVEKTSKRGK